MANANTSDDDAEKMRLAFEQFMLSGGKNNNSAKKGSNESSSTATTPQSTSNKSKKKKKKKRQSTGGVTPTKKVAATPPPVSTTKNSSSQKSPQQKSTPNPKIKKRYYQLLRSFNDKVKHTWIEIDQQLLSVLQNIVSIRGRLPHEWKVLSQAERYFPAMVEEKQEYDFIDVNDDGWKSHGQRGMPFSYHLQIDDIQLAISYDLEQHEKMLVGLRSLMSNMAECHDALGRIVDSLWQFHLEVEDNNENEGMKDDMDNIVNCATSLYQMLSMEVYKKQNMISSVIDSTEDDIFGMNEANKGVGVATKSQKFVRECCASWKRSTRDEELLMNVMSLGASS